MIKDRNTLEYIFTLVKQVKKPLVKIYPNGTIIGTDEQFASLNIYIPEIVNYNIDIPYIFRITEITAFMRDISIYETSMIFSQYEIIMPLAKLGKYIDTTKSIILTNHLELNYKFDELYSKIADIQLHPIIYKNEEFHKSNFDMLSMKLADCSRMFTVDERFLMTSFNSIHPATKADKVELVIRDYDYYSYIGEFIIYRKKDKSRLHEFLRFRKL